jgi:hypothetical protein
MNRKHMKKPSDGIHWPSEQATSLTQATDLDISTNYEQDLHVIATDHPENPEKAAIRKGNAMKTCAIKFAQAIVPLSEKISMCKWTASMPVTKKLGLDSEGSFKKLSTAAHLYEGKVTQIEATPTAFLNILKDIEPNDCLSYATPVHSNVHSVLSRQRYLEQGQPAGTMTRTVDQLIWPHGAGVLMLDYDPEGGCILSKEELLQAIYSICPELQQTAHLWSASTSSCLYNEATGEEVRGIHGQRVYVIVSNGTDIPRAGMVLFKRLWLNGFGHIKISKAGSMLVRSIVDNCVWQTNRIDYVAPPDCEPPLVSRKPSPELLGNVAYCLATQVALPDLSNDETLGFESMVTAAKSAKEAEAREVREIYLADRIGKLVESGMPLADAEATVRAALDTSVLHADFVLEMTNGTMVTVREILANKERFHNETFADPLEPDYHDDKRIARVKLLGVSSPYLWSYAHGGQKYRLLFQRETVIVAKGQRGAYIPRITKILDSRDLVFARGSSVVSISDDGKLAIKGKLGLLALIDQTIHFERRTTKGDEPMDAPTSWSELIIGGHVERFRQLSCVLTAPIIVPSTGRIISQAGYDQEQRVYAINADQFEPIPVIPDMDDVRAALKALWLPVSQFPFCTPTDQTVMLTAMLTAVVRKLLPTSPGFGFDAPVQGSGKTLLLKVLAALTGETPTISPQPDSMSDDEMRKRIFAMLREGKGTLVIDNIVGNFDSPSLAAAVTSVSYSDRVLGESRSETVPSTALVLLSGNNLKLMGDLPRRVLVCRIDPKIETPHARSFNFDPEQLVTQYRQELVAAAIILMHAYMEANPAEKPGLGRMASFEIWDDLVRQTVCWLAKLQHEGILSSAHNADATYPELVDPMEAVNAAVRADPKKERQAVLLLEIAKVFGFGIDGKPGPIFTTGELVNASNPGRYGGTGAYAFSHEEDDNSLFEAIVEVGGDSVGRRINKRSLGKYLSSIKDQIVNGLTLRQGPDRRHYATWWIEHVGRELGELGEFVSGKEKLKQPVKKRS